MRPADHFSSLLASLKNKVVMNQQQAILDGWQKCRGISYILLLLIRMAPMGRGRGQLTQHAELRCLQSHLPTSGYASAPLPQSKQRQHPVQSVHLENRVCFIISYYSLPTNCKQVICPNPLTHFCNIFLV